jgi:hypothetical protein
MNHVSRVVTGTILIVLGVVLAGVSPFVHFGTLFYSVPVLIVGVFILLNKKEDIIEQRKDLNKKHSKK